MEQVVKYKTREKGARWKDFTFLGRKVTDIDEAIALIRTTYKSGNFTYIELKQQVKGGELTWDNW